MAAQVVDAVWVMRSAAEKGASFQMIFDISSLQILVSTKRHPVCARAVAYIDIVEDGNHKYVKGRIPPPHHHSWSIRLANVRRPEHSH